jgi:NAD(P)-dependent dehydrogenase (short-subunit alcohol dehydrogenase family)
MMDVGVKSNFIAAWHAAQIMVPQKSGLIVNISGYAAVTYTYSVLFGTAKTAVGRMARDMAVELKPHGVASLTLWQGLTLTEKAKDNLAKVADCDPALMKRSGGEFITAEIAHDYGITDDDGTWVASMRETRGSPIWQPV